MKTCAFCHVESADVATALVRFLEPDEEGNRFGRLPRCRTRTACRTRVEAAGGMPVLDELWTSVLEPAAAES